MKKNTNEVNQQDPIQQLLDMQNQQTRFQILQRERKINKHTTQRIIATMSAGVSYIVAALTSYLSIHKAYHSGHFDHTNVSSMTLLDTTSNAINQAIDQQGYLAPVIIPSVFALVTAAFIIKGVKHSISLKDLQNQVIDWNNATGVNNENENREESKIYIKTLTKKAKLIVEKTQK